MLLLRTTLYTDKGRWVTWRRPVQLLTLSGQYCQISQRHYKQLRPNGGVHFILSYFFLIWCERIRDNSQWWRTAEFFWTGHRLQELTSHLKLITILGSFWDWYPKNNISRQNVGAVFCFVLNPLMHLQKLFSISIYLFIFNFLKPASVLILHIKCMIYLFLIVNTYIAKFLSWYNSILWSKTYHNVLGFFLSILHVNLIIYGLTVAAWCNACER